MAVSYGSNIAADIAAFVQTVYDGANLVARQNDFMTSLVYAPQDGVAGTATRSRSEYGTATFQQITDGDDLASQAFTPSVANSVNPAFYGAQFFVTDRRRRTDIFGVARDAAQELGLSASKHVQQKLITYFSSFTGGTVGTAGGTITWGNVFAARAYLNRQAAPDPVALVLEPGQWYYLANSIAPGATVTNAPDLQNEAARRFYVATVAGVNIYVTPDIASGTAAVAGMFARDALVFDERKPFGIESQRDASRGGGGDELNATMEYGAGVWRPKWGVQLIGTSVLA